MKQFLAGTALLAMVGLAGVTQPARAADLNEFRDSSQGRGSIRLPNGRTDQLRRAEVEFRRGGDGTVRLVGDRTYHFNGKWNNGGGRTLQFRISRVLDQDNQGDGIIRFRGNDELTQITITSRVRGRAYSANFQSNSTDPGGGWNGGGSIREFRGEREGQGTLKIQDRDNDPLRRVLVDLRRGGDATVTFNGKGQDPRVMSGRWKSVDSRTAEVRLDEIFGDDGRNTNGRLRVRFNNRNGNNRRLERVTGEGTVRDRRFSLDFDADGDSGGGGGNQPGGELGLTSTRRGTGSLTVGGRRNEFLGEARVLLERNGNATIRLSTDEASFTVTGKWFKRQNSANLVDIDIDRYGEAAASGKGTLRLEFSGGRSFDRIDLDGQTGGGRLTVDFRAR
jgi:hypothetical protein